ncbi:MAG: NifU family protein [Candidatus Hodarchaeota archaeon]
MAIKEEIASSLEQLRPYLQKDGGDVEFVDYDVDKGILKVRLTGTCRGCPYSQMTLSAGIKRNLQEHFPQIQEVVNV